MEEGTTEVDTGVRRANQAGLPVIIAEDPLTCVARGGGRALELMDERGGDIFTVE